MNKTLLEIWPIFHDPDGEAEKEFWNDWVASPLGSELSTATSPALPELDQGIMYRIYFMLIGRYGNSHIVSEDEGLWKYRFITTMYEYAPAFQQRYKVQKRLRTMSEEDMLKGAIQKTTHGFNPSTDVSGNTDTEITTVNDQNLLKYTKGTLDGYNNLLELLKSDVTEQFVSKFKPLFIKVPLKNYWKEDDDE